jgi:DNA-binding transcriptional LysR family regulator
VVELQSAVQMSHTSSSRPTLDDIDAVLFAAQTGSFSAASEKLGVTHGAVSRRVASVEVWAGLKIFARHGRGVHVTLEGQVLIDQLEQAIAVIDNSLREVGVHESIATLYLSVVPSFARLFILPNLEHLEGTPRDVKIEIDIDQRIVALSSTRIAVRHGAGQWSGVSSTPIFQETLVPVASTEIVEELGDNPEPSAILDYPLLLDTLDKGWKSWFAACNVNYKPRHIDREFADYDLTLQAASLGLGVALMRSPFGLKQARKMGLKPVSTIRVPSATQFFIVAQLGARTLTIDAVIARMIEASQALHGTVIDI